MKIHLSTLKAWAALKPHPSLPAKLKRAFIRFAPVTINRQRVCVPAKAAVRWARSTGIDAFEFDPERKTLRAFVGTSHISLACPVDNVPIEDPWSMETCMKLRIRDYDRTPIARLLTA